MSDGHIGSNCRRVTGLARPSATTSSCRDGTPLVGAMPLPVRTSVAATAHGRRMDDTYWGDFGNLHLRDPDTLTDDERGSLE